MVLVYPFQVTQVRLSLGLEDHINEPPVAITLSDNMTIPQDEHQKEQVLKHESSSLHSVV